MKVHNLKLIEDTLNSVHPKQIINNVGNFKMTLHKVKYSYTTNRGNRREGEKILFNNGLNPEVDTESELLKWVKDYNKENAHRQISNVEFLESQCVGYINI